MSNEAVKIYRAIELKAPGIIERTSIKEPVITGSGKTAIAIDTIAIQHHQNESDEKNNSQMQSKEKRFWLCFGVIAVIGAVLVYTGLWTTMTYAHVLRTSLGVGALWYIFNPIFQDYKDKWNHVPHFMAPRDLRLLGQKGKYTDVQLTPHWGVATFFFFNWVVYSTFAFLLHVDWYIYFITLVIGYILHLAIFLWINRIEYWMRYKHNDYDTHMMNMYYLSQFGPYVLNGSLILGFFISTLPLRPSLELNQPGQIGGGRGQRLGDEVFRNNASNASTFKKWEFLLKDRRMGVAALQIFNDSKSITAVKATIVPVPTVANLQNFWSAANDPLYTGSPITSTPKTFQSTPGPIKLAGTSNSFGSPIEMAQQDVLQSNFFLLPPATTVPLVANPPNTLLNTTTPRNFVIVGPDLGEHKEQSHRSEDTYFLDQLKKEKAIQEFRKQAYDRNTAWYTAINIEDDPIYRIVQRHNPQSLATVQMHLQNMYSLEYRLHALNLQKVFNTALPHAEYATKEIEFCYKKETYKAFTFLPSDTFVQFYVLWYINDMDRVASQTITNLGQLDLLTNDSEREQFARANTRHTIAQNMKMMLYLRCINDRAFQPLKP